MARLPVPHQVSEKAAEITSRAALSSAVQKGADRGNAVVPRPLHLICIGRLIQANAYNGPRYDCGRPGRRRDHNRANNMGVSEGQDARSRNYRRSIRFTPTEVK